MNHGYTHVLRRNQTQPNSTQLFSGYRRHLATMTVSAMMTRTRITWSHADNNGPAKCNLSWPVSATPLAWAMFGGFHTCVIKAAEVCNTKSKTFWCDFSLMWLAFSIFHTGRIFNDHKLYCIIPALNRYSMGNCNLPIAYCWSLHGKSYELNFWLNYFYFVIVVGVFLIPYFIILFVCGIPMLFMELAVGQYTGRGPIGAIGQLCPLFKG